MALLSNGVAATPVEYITKGITNCASYSFPRNFCGYIGTDASGVIRIDGDYTIFQNGSTSSSSNTSGPIAIAKNTTLMGCQGNWSISGYLFD